MKTLGMLAAGIGLTIVLGASLARADALIIELHNGRELTTSRVWEEGDELKFSASAGTAGVPRALVKRMKTSTPVSNDTLSSSALSPNTSHPKVPTTHRPVQANSHREPEIPQEGGHRQAPHAQNLESAKSLGAGDAHAYRAKKLTLTGELDATTNQYLAASGARNPDAKQAALDGMREYSKQIIDLGDKVKKMNGGVLPAWWNE